jgi:hypothetical protein
MIERPTMKPYTMLANQSFTEHLHISPRLDAAHIFPTRSECSRRIYGQRRLGVKLEYVAPSTTGQKDGPNGNGPYPGRATPGCVVSATAVGAIHRRAEPRQVREILGHRTLALGTTHRTRPGTSPRDAIF